MQFHEKFSMELHGRLGHQSHGIPWKSMEINEYYPLWNSMED